MTANSMLARARRDLGMRGRPNPVTRWYANRQGSAFLRAPWCNMAVTRWAVESGNYAAVCFGTDYAYTVWHAQRFQRAGRWYWGASGARPGDIVFFDWGGSNSISRIDHVGIVEANLGGGRLQTIEGNTSDACLRRVRSGNVIVGYGRPDYTNSGTGGNTMVGLKEGDKGEEVKELQTSLRHAGFGHLLGNYGPRGDGVDGEYGAGTSKAVLACRKWVGSSAKSGKTVSGSAAAQIRRAVARREAERAAK